MGLNEKELKKWNTTQWKGHEIVKLSKGYVKDLSTFLEKAYEHSYFNNYIKTSLLYQTIESHLSN